MASSKQPDWKSLALKSAGIVAGAGVTGVTAWVLYSRFILNHNQPLPKAIDARRSEDNIGEFGLTSHYEDSADQGPPLVLVHSVNAAASAYEMRPLFERYRGRRPVYAPDLPGFGHSARVDRDYSPDFYAEAIAAWVEKKVYRGQPVDAVALSLSSEFVARAALRYPNLFRSLVLISPTGLEKRAEVNPRTGDRVRKVLSAPVLSQPFFDALITKPSIRHYLRKAFFGPVDDGLAEYAYATAHQPGARYAPLYFLSGNLFSPDVLYSVYGRLYLPCLVLYDDDEYVGFDELPALTAGRSNWRAVRILETGSMPHFEKPRETAGQMSAFWAGLPAPSRESRVSPTFPG